MSTSVEMKPRASVRIAVWMWFGAAIVASGCAVGMTQIPAGAIPFAEWIRPAHFAMAAAGFVCFGFLAMSIARQSEELIRSASSAGELKELINALRDEMIDMGGRMPDMGRIGESVGAACAESAARTEAKVTRLETAIEQARAVVDAVRQKQEDAERARLTLAGTLDSLNARIDKLVRLSQDSKTVDVAKELKPLADMIHNNESASNAMIQKQFACIVDLQNTIAGLQTHLDEQMRENAAEMSRMIESARATTPAPLMHVTEIEASRPVDAEEEAKTTISEGPREARTVLTAIDKLRAMRST
ncbi:MAG: hypothetical protein HY286_09155 [Planctomycetes bacterium]|nr:hypothetical protein [Planctomycetota bacterium]